MKTKLLFMTTIMGTGGVEKALINMIDLLVKDSSVDITVLLVKQGGEFEAQLPKGITIKSIALQGISYENICKRKSLKRIVYDNISRFNLPGAAGAIYRKWVRKDYFYYLPIAIENAKILDLDLEVEYDLAVCYHMHFPFNLVYVAGKVKAKKKVAWIHNDFITTQFKVKRFKNDLKKYNHFFAVSEQLKTEFLEFVPDFKDKVNVLNNILPAETILQRAQELYPPEFSDNEKMKLLSIGRLNEQKGFDIAIEVCNKLKALNYDFIWYIVGEGEERSKLETRIEELGIRDWIQLIGVRQNPYPYIKNCDIYVQPSRHEGCSIAITEAKLLCKPIVFTNVSGAREQLVNEKTGLIVPIDERAIFEAVKRLIMDPSLRKTLSENLKKELEQKTDIQQIKKIYDLLNSN